MRICLTVDVEWAPEFVIDWMFKKLKNAGVSATWFATHDSEAVKRIARDPAHEIGLHPNFFPNSTQGRDMEGIMSNLKLLYPEARGIRSHAFLDSTRHQCCYRRLGFKYVSNVLIWNNPSKPFFVPWTNMWHIPLSWEDDVACNHVKYITLDLPAADDSLLYVLNFHPLYCYLNEKRGMCAYAELKARYASPKDASFGYLNRLRQSGRGLNYVLEDVLGKSRKHEFVTLGAVYDKCKRRR